MELILVTGATGTVGRQLVRQLAEAGQSVRALVRNADWARPLLGPDIEYVQGDLADAESLRMAMSGVAQVFLACGNHPGQLYRENNAIDASVVAGVDRIVKLSALGAQIGAEVAFLDAHGRITEHLASTGVPAVLLEPAFSMANLLGAADSVSGMDSILLPAGDASMAMIDPADVAAAATAVLTGAGGSAERHVLTGPSALSFAEVAAVLSDLLGRRISYVPVPDDDAVVGMVATGMPDWFATNVVAQFRRLRAGDQAVVTGAVQTLTGRPARPVADFLADHAGVFRSRSGQPVPAAALA